MAFERPITISEALQSIHRHDYVLPAIQREFVWKPTQICRLFDSLMQGYPIGSFLFWHVQWESVDEYKFYDFVRNYHQRDAQHCPDLDLPHDQAVTAVLDGQQRLTALNIGLRGSLRIKEPHKRWNNPNAFPERKLYLNLLALAEENEEGMHFAFDFLTESKAQQRSDTHFWFPVPEIMQIEDGPDMNDYLTDNEVATAKKQRRDVFRRLDKLHSVVHREGIISFFLEKSQDLEKVLNIFIRTNSGGTVLSYSDLLLSIAVAQWETLDARKEIHGLVDELNRTRIGFGLSKDFVLKAGLMLTDIASVGFKVTNFNRKNMQVLEANWRKVEQALRVTIQLIASFGFSARTLTADSAVLPIAYYLCKRGADESFVNSRKHAEDRETIRYWLVRSLLKSGVWGSGLDVTLTSLRGVIQKADSERFPVEPIERDLARRGRSLRFEEEEVQELADVQFGDRHVFPLLSLLFPFVDLRNEFHVDHVFPHTRFRKPSLLKAGIPASDVDRFKDMAERIGNLQLLEGIFNQEKSATMPRQWMNERFGTDHAGKDHARKDHAGKDYCERHELGNIPECMSAFPDFYEARRERLANRIRGLLNVADGDDSNVSAT